MQSYFTYTISWRQFFVSVHLESAIMLLVCIMKFVKAILIIWICCEIQEVVLKTATRKGSINDIVFPFEIRRKMIWNEEIKIILYQYEYLCSVLLVFHFYLCEFHFQYFWYYQKANLIHIEISRQFYLLMMQFGWFDICVDLYYQNKGLR